MPGTGKAQQRLESFYRLRAPTGPGAAPAFAAPVPLAEARLDALAAYRRAQRPAAGFGPVPDQPNWVPIGPAGVRRGQAGGSPMVSGRVPQLAVTKDGQRVYVASANGGVWRSSDSGRTWEPRSDEFEFLQDPDPTVPNEAPDLTHHVDSLACGALALVEGPARDQDTLYVGLGEAHAIASTPSAGYFGAGIIRSDNGGGTWRRETANPTLVGAGIYDIVVDPTNKNHALAVTTRGVYRRTGDAATGTWNREVAGFANAAGPLADLAVSGAVVYRNGADVCFAVISAGNGIINEWSTATGTWQGLGGGSIPANATALRTELAVSASNPPVIYALSSKATPNPNPSHVTSTHGLFRLDRGVNRWVRVTIPAGTDILREQGHYDIAICVDPHDPNMVYVGGAWEADGAGIWRVRVTAPASAAATTTPGAFTHIGNSVHPDVHCLTFRPDSSDELWVGCDGGVFTTTNAKGAGNSLFRPRNEGLATLTLNGLIHHNTEESWVYCGAQDNGSTYYSGQEVWNRHADGDGGASVFDTATGTQLLNGYVNNAIRRQQLNETDHSESAVNLPAGASAEFYPPMERAPGAGRLIVVGAERPYVRSTFANGPWTSVPKPAGAANTDRITAIAVASDLHFWVGWDVGRVTEYTRANGNAATPWVPTDRTPPAGPVGPGPLERRPVTGIAIDLTDGTGASVFITLGGPAGQGARVRRFARAAAAAAPTWDAGAMPAGLIDIHHNRVMVDPDNHQHVWAAADLGIWHSSDSGANWTLVSGNLPDVAVLDLDFGVFPVDAADQPPPAPAAPPPIRLLRATTHGRGVFELLLDAQGDPVAAPRAELMLRCNLLDVRRRSARANKPQPTKPGTPAAPGPRTVVDASPDIFVDAPDASGLFTLPLDVIPTVSELQDTLPRDEVLASVPGTPVDTRVYVVVRNRGAFPKDDVRVSLFVGPEGQALPDDFRTGARGGAFGAGSEWKLAGTTSVNGVVAGRPKVAVFALSSDKLPPKDEALGKHYRLLALLHHADDPFPADAPTDVEALVRHERRAAMKRVAAVDATRRGSSRGGTGLLIPMGTTVAAHDRLTEIRDRLRTKVAAGGPNLHHVERRVLAMAEAGLASLELGVRAPVPAGSPGAGIGKYALLGALGFEIPAYSTAFVPGGPWVAETLHRGTGDPHLSKVAVAASELPLRLATIGRNETTGADQDSIRAIASGMLSAAAAGVVLSPQVADLHARDTAADWSPFLGTRGAGALEHYLRQEYLPGASPTTLGGWLPATADVPTVVWEKYLKAIGDTYGLPTNPKAGFGSFEADFNRTLYPSPAHLKSGYGMLLGDLQSSAWSAGAWWGALLPVVLAPVGALAIARELPHAAAFFNGGELTERAWFELLTVGLGIGSVMPSIYSMLLWSQVDFHTGAFTNALVLGLLRAGLLTTALATSGVDDLPGWARWGLMYTPLQGLDVYAFIRALISDRDHPGAQKVFAIQTVPTLSTLVTLGLAGIGRAVTDGGDNDTRNFWILAGVSSGVLMLGAIPLAFALRGTGGWQAWFRPDPPDLPLLSSVANAGITPSRPQARARVFEASKLWADPAVASPRTDELAYPPGTRPLVRMWWEGSGDLTARVTRRSVTFRHGAEETTVDVPAGSTATSLAALLQGRMAGLKAETVGADTPPRPLPSPDALADAGDLVPFEQAEERRTAFTAVGTSRARATVLRETPRVVASTTFGRTAPAGAPYPVLPTSPSSTGAAADSGLRDAADLAALMIIAASPTLTPVTAPGAAPPAVAEVRQVFRRWNLDERRLDEWRTLMTGHGATAVPADTLVGTQNPMIRTQPNGYHPQADSGRVLAEAMGWLPLWRTWIDMATTPGQNAGSTAAAPASRTAVPMPAGPPKRPTNKELTDAVAYLLDMAAP